MFSVFIMKFNRAVCLFQLIFQKFVQEKSSFFLPVCFDNLCDSDLVPSGADTPAQAEVWRIGRRGAADIDLTPLLN